MYDADSYSFFLRETQTYEIIDDISKLDPKDKDVYYKEDPYTPKKIHQTLIVLWYNIMVTGRTKLLKSN